MGRSTLDVHTLEGDGHLVVLVRGKLDRSTVDAFREQLERAGAVPHVVVDLAGVTFMDSSGARAVAEARRARDGETFRIVGVRTTVTRILRVRARVRAGRTSRAVA